jgi:SAM-dependent methyltransferase
MTATFWDERFADREFLYGTEPNVFLVEQAHRLAPGSRILLPGDGEGRNGVWLAGRGMDVLSVDASAVGLAKAQRLARDRGLSIKTDVADLGAWAWPSSGFDAIVSLFLHLALPERASIHGKMIDALKPGGILILEAFRLEQLAYSSGGPKDPTLLYSAGQLKAEFRAIDILLLEEALVDLDEGKLHQGPGATVRLVARKA